MKKIHKLFIVFTALAIIFCLSIFCTSGNEPIMTLEEMREQAKEIPYNDLARYPDEYKGDPVIYQGEIIQKISSTEYRVNITEGSYGFWSDTIYIVLNGEAKKVRLLEDDIIEFVGLAKGEFTYKAVLGQRVSIPRIDAYEVKILE